MGRLSENRSVTKNKSHSVTAQLVVPDGGAQGVIIARRRLWGLEPVRQRGSARLLLQPVRAATLQGLRRGAHPGRRASGPDGVRHDGGGLAKGAQRHPHVDGAKAGEGRVEVTVPMLFSADETTDVGSDGGTPVSDEDYGPKDSRSAAGCGGSRSTWTSTTTTTSSAPRSAWGSPWPGSNRHEPGQGPWPPCFPSAATGYTAAVADGTPALTVQESPGRVRPASAALPTATGPPSRTPPTTWSSASSPTPWPSGPAVRALAEMTPPDLAAMDLLYQLGEPPPPAATSAAPAGGQGEYQAAVGPCCRCFRQEGIGISVLVTSTAP